VLGFAALAQGRLWPNSAVTAIRPEQQLSGDKLPSTAMAHNG